MLRVLLINPPWLFRPTTLWNFIDGKNIPYGIAYIAAVLKKNYTAVNVEIIDAYAENLSLDALRNRIKDFKPDILGITACTANFKDAILVVQKVKEILPKCKIVIGGRHATFCPEEALKYDFIDIVVRGEGEYTFLEIVEGVPIQSIKGISYRIDGGITHNLNRELVEDIDNIPIPAFELLPMKNYYLAAGQVKEFPAATLLGSRGCPGRCVYCSSSVFENKVRYRSVKNIISEIEYLILHYKIKEIHLLDDAFTANKELVLEFCNTIKQKNIKILWDCFSRASHVDFKLLLLMKNSGCRQISFGIESGDREVLRSIKKGVTLEMMEQAISDAKRAGLEVKSSFMLGLPMDTVESMQKTIKFAKKLDAHIASFYIATPFPGTEMYTWASREKRFKTQNWSLYDLTHPVMQLPYVTAEQVYDFYCKAWRVFYVNPVYLLKHLMMLNRFSDFSIYWRAICGIFYEVFFKKINKNNK